MLNKNPAVLVAKRFDDFVAYGYDVCTLGMKSRRCVSILRFEAINHAKQRSFQCALMCPCAQITDQKVN